MVRLKLTCEGAVQGVGFRPFSARLARKHGLSGWVRNDPRGAELLVAGSTAAVEAFISELKQAPAPIRVKRLLATPVGDEPYGLRSGEICGESFHIIRSLGLFYEAPLADAELPRAPQLAAQVMPPDLVDLSLCDACRRELWDPNNRRYRYAFTACSSCGPRYSILRALPYDRERTELSAFALCSACQAEYSDPGDRRYHAQAIQCPACGPTLSLLSSAGQVVARGDDALEAALTALRQGKILASLGLGGFQLLADATNSEVVEKLRQRKHRPHKPFAVLFADLESLGEHLVTTPAALALLGSAQSPIVLLRRRLATTALPLAPQVAPENPLIGALLPYTPLHELLARGFGRPLLCTSGNLAEEPMVTRREVAQHRLSGVADVFLTHDRPVTRPMDDSVAVPFALGTLLLRRARGFVLAPLAGKDSNERFATHLSEGATLAFGAELKHTASLLCSGTALISQHLGDAGNSETLQLLEQTALELEHLAQVPAQAIACDLHPDFASTRLAERWAEERGLPLHRVQHHHAHVAAVCLEHREPGPVLGFAWDGFGYGLDGTLWGGELLWVELARSERLGHLQPFRLPGGEQAAREPRRAALGVVHAVDPDFAAELAWGWFGQRRGSQLISLLSSRVSSPKTTSVGRLFDAVAALLELSVEVSFEGQAAMAVQFAAESDASAGTSDPAFGPQLLSWQDGERGMSELSFAPLVRELGRLRKLGLGAENRATLARHFHQSLARAARAGVERFSAREPRAVVLCGGCFQNPLLLELTVAELRAAGQRVLWPEQLPPGDGAISAGQALVSSARLRADEAGAPCVLVSPVK